MDPLILKVGAGRKWLISRPARFNPEKEPSYPLNRNLGKPQSRSRRLGDKKNLLPLPGFEARTIQALA